MHPDDDPALGEEFEYVVLGDRYLPKAQIQEIKESLERHMTHPETKSQFDVLQKKCEGIVEQIEPLNNKYVLRVDSINIKDEFERAVCSDFRGNTDNKIKRSCINFLRIGESFVDIDKSTATLNELEKWLVMQQFDGFRVKKLLFNLAFMALRDLKKRIVENGSSETKQLNEIKAARDASQAAALREGAGEAAAGALRADCRLLHRGYDL